MVFQANRVPALYKALNATTVGWKCRFSRYAVRPALSNIFPAKGIRSMPAAAGVTFGRASPARWFVESLEFLGDFAD